MIAVAVAALAACKKEGEQAVPGFGPRGPAVDVDKLQAPALFAHIPADTPYVLASFEAVSLDYYAKVKRAMGPAVSRAVDKLRGKAEADPDIERWIDAITKELDGKWSAKGLESLGLSAQPRFAIYGHGALPVVARLEIKDDKALLATIERVAKRAGETLPALENRHGREFWRIDLAKDMGAIIAIADKQLVLAFGPKHMIAAVLPQIVGAEKPTRNMAGGEELKKLIAKHRLGPVMIGYIDSKHLATSLIAASERTPPAECKTEIDRLAAQVPRFVLSYTEITDKRFSGGAILELAPPLVEQLKEMRTSVPGLSAALSGNPMFAMGGGLDLVRGKAAGKAVAATLRDLGKACDSEELVRAAREMRDGLSEPLPEPFEKFTGAALALDSIDFGQGRLPIPRSVDGFGMLAIRDAKTAFESLSAGLPVKIKADGKLHEVDLGNLGLPFDLPFEIHAGVGDGALVIASGSRGKSQAEKALSSTGGAKSPFFAATIDMSKLVELQTRLAPFADDDDMDNVKRDIDASMAEIIGRTTFSIDVTDAGLAIWASGEMK